MRHDCMYRLILDDSTSFAVNHFEPDGIANHIIKRGFFYIRTAGHYVDDTISRYLGSFFSKINLETIDFETGNIIEDIFEGVMFRDIKELYQDPHDKNLYMNMLEFTYRSNYSNHAVDLGE